MKKLRLIQKSILILALALGIFVYVASKKLVPITSVKESKLVKLKKLPKFNGTTIDGKAVSNIDLLKNSKKYLVIHFWATWCGSCEKELPELLKFIARSNSDKINFVIINYRDSFKDIKSFYSKRNITISKKIIQINDSDGTIASKFGTVYLPETYIFNSKSELEKNITGPVDWNSNKNLEEILK